MADAVLTEAPGWPVWARTPKGANARATARPSETILLTIVIDSGQYLMQCGLP
jgi:hypothetical protein